MRTLIRPLATVALAAALALGTTVLTAGLPDAKPLATGSHVHANWAFGSAGTYTVKVLP